MDEKSFDMLYDAVVRIERKLDEHIDKDIEQHQNLKKDICGSINMRMLCGLLSGIGLFLLWTCKETIKGFVA